MGRRKIMAQFARWHIWLGWLVGVPILMWTASGLIMVARPIEEVRGDHLIAAPSAIANHAIIWPQMDEPIRSARLDQQANGPVWIVTGTDGGIWRHSATDGAILPPISEEEARSIAQAAYIGAAALEGLTYFPADAAPREMRAGRPVWQARYDDGTNLYIDDGTGQILATRTPFWRIYDFVWGLHIMDLETREDSHHPILIIFAALSLIGVCLGIILMFRRRKAPVRR